MKHSEQPTLATSSTTYMAMLVAMQLPTSPTSTSTARELARAELFCFHEPLTATAYALSEIIGAQIEPALARSETGAKYVELNVAEFGQHVGPDLARLGAGLAGFIAQSDGMWRTHQSATHAAPIDLEAVLAEIGEVQNDA